MGASLIQADRRTDGQMDALMDGSETDTTRQIGLLATMREGLKVCSFSTYKPKALF